MLFSEFCKKRKTVGDPPELLPSKVGRTPSPAADLGRCDGVVIAARDVAHTLLCSSSCLTGDFWARKNQTLRNYLHK